MVKKKSLTLFDLWKYIKDIKKKFKAINSTKSQFHQPPQPNSCSAHQHPKTNEVFEDKSKNTYTLFKLVFLYGFLNLSLVLQNPNEI